MAFTRSKSIARRVRRELGQQAPTPPPTLGQLSAAFAPKFVLPKDRRQAQTARNIRTTLTAVRQVSQQRGVSMREAGRQLIQVRGQVERRNVALARGRTRGVDPARTLATLRFGTDIDPKLLQVTKSEFVTPEGRFEVATVPGRTLRRRRLRPPLAPRPRPAPRATPRR